jgi:Spy/CpxP family protein refolding chaperone
MTRRFLAVALVIAAALPLAAQGPRGFGGGPRGVDFLAGYLGLSDAQKTQAQTIFDAANTAKQTALGQRTSAQNALTAAAKAGQTDAQLDTLAAAVGVIDG